MDTSHNPNFSHRKKLCLPYYSFKKSCFFFLTFILLIALVLGFAALIIFVVLKPQKPVFSIQTAKIESYKLETLSNKDLFVSSVLSLTLNAVNPNKVGISYYSTTRFHVLENGFVIGMIKVPRFDQPPHSKNLSVQAHVMFDCVNISDITSGKSMLENSGNPRIFQMRISGDVRAQLRILQLALPKLRIFLDCDIRIDQKYLQFNYAMNNMKAEKSTEMISLPTGSKLISNKCTHAIYI